MADHRPTYGSRLRATFPWVKTPQLYCVCGERWPCLVDTAERFRAANEAALGEPPIDIIQTAEGGFHLLGDQAFTEAEKRANGGRW